MKLRLIREARIRHLAGDIVEVSPAEAGFLLSTGSAVEVTEELPKRETPEKNVKKETPEAAAEKPATRKKTTKEKA